MPTRDFYLTDEQDAFLDEVVRSGKYQNASDAVRDAVHGLELRLKSEASKLERLQTEVNTGLEALDRGHFTEVEDAELDAALDDLVAPAR